MCEAAVFLDREGELEKIMDDVVEIKPEEGKLLLGLLGMPFSKD